MCDKTTTHIDLPDENASRAVCKALVSGDIQQAGQRPNLVQRIVARLWNSFREAEIELFEACNKYLDENGPIKVLSA